MKALKLVDHAPGTAPAARRRHILLVGDDRFQLKLSSAYLTAEGHKVSTAASASQALDAARVRRPDVIVSDVTMRELDGFALCSLLRCDPDLASTPILLISGSVDSGERDMAMSSGACGLVERSLGFRAELAALAEVVDRQVSAPAPALQPLPQPSLSRMASQMARLLARSRSADERYQTLFDNASEAISVLAPDGTILEVNRCWEDILQRPRHDVVGRHISEFAPHLDENGCASCRDLSGTTRLPTVPIVVADGSTVHMEFSSRVVVVGGDRLVLTIGRNVTEGVVGRRNLAASEERYRTLIENLPDVVWSATAEGRITLMSPPVLKICGFTAEEVMAGPAGWWFGRIHPEDVDRVGDAYRAISARGHTVEYRWQHKNGDWVWLRSSLSLRTSAEGVGLAEGTFADITENKRLEDQLRQAQKMEAVGRLTGGIAHDFNNMLTVILGNGELLQAELPEGDPRRSDIDAVLEAGRRAAGLTTQLLAFSRRQIIEPQVLDLGQIVSGFEKMLGRLIGEDIVLSISVPQQLGLVCVDAGQIEQVLMNLVVNARDAMPRGGRLSIGAADVVLDAERASALALEPGEYVALSIADSGCGMDAETKRHLFEPFFTTKDIGKGTGLGLSTCYGIVTQSDGRIEVESEPGQGSVFRVYFPRTIGELDAGRGAAAAPSETLTGSETILLIEDNTPLRALTHRVLTAQGYQLLEARDGDEALAVAAAHPGAIDLVLSDVVVPGLSGPDIVSRIQDSGRHPKALFMSGYTEHPALMEAAIQTSVNFIQKPFLAAAIAQKVRATLDAD